MIRSLHDHDKRCVSANMFGEDQKLVEKFVTKLVCEVKKNCAEAE